MGLVDEVKVHFPHSFFLFECLVSIIAPNVMVIPNANNLSLLNELSIELILFGVCEPFLNVPEIHRVISDPLGLWDVICISRITQPGPKVRAMLSPDNTEDVIREIKDPVAWSKS